jgi:GTP:adenosylcobinamide-phosphate guanylyltransferase
MLYTAYESSINTIDVTFDPFEPTMPKCLEVKSYEITRGPGTGYDDDTYESSENSDSSPED